MSAAPGIEIEKLQADIVVIGGGGSGLVAAVAAAENGAKNVIVLEKAAHPGGNAMLAVGMMAVESPAQKRLGIKTSQDQVFKEAMEAAKWKIDPEVVRAYVNKSGEIIGWLEGKGVKFDLVGAGVGGILGHGFSERQGRYRSIKNLYAQGPGFAGSTVVEAMLDDCQKSGIKVITRTRAEKILLNRSGAVCGILASTTDKKYEISTKSVIISAGSFCGNKEMMLKYFNINIKGQAYHHALPDMTGDGIIMAGEIGAFIDDRLFSMHWLFPSPSPKECPNSIRALLGRPEMLRVNIKGKRFMDESTANSVLALNRQPGQICYAIADSATVREIKETPQPPNPMPTTSHILDSLYEDLDKVSAEKKYIWKVNTIEELSALFKGYSEDYKSTVNSYNAFCKNGYDKDFIKDPKYLKPIRVPPFYVFFEVQGYSYTHGGIRINENMEALNNEDKPISGLYATGLNASQWVTDNYAHSGT